MRVVAALLIAALVGPLPALGQRVETGFINRTIVNGTQTRRYQVFVPGNYTPDQRWPVILYLHGGGEQGDDGLLPTEGGLGSAIRRSQDRWPAIVVFPQVRAGKRWNGEDAAWALKALEQTEREFATDANRVYLTGISRGGAGAYYLAYRDPGRFAALLVVAGRITAATTLDGQPAPDLDPVIPASAGDPFDALAAKLKNIPTWVFHGDADMTISVEESRRAVAALKRFGGRITYTELPGVGHNAWDTAYRDGAVSRWLFSNRTSR
ncbi:MAG: PHB depolymerase family esterase [Gemmatimonadales bacterium]